MKKVLIVDDEATTYGARFLEAFAESLKDFTFCKVQDVKTFNEATLLVKQEEPDIVLLDGYYKGESLGRALVEWMQRECPGIQIIGNSSAPKLWLKLDIHVSEDKFSPDTVRILRSLSVKERQPKPTKVEDISMPSTPTVTPKGSASEIRWDRIAIVRDNLTGEYTVLFTFDESEAKQRELYEDESDKRTRLVSFLQLSLQMPPVRSISQNAVHTFLANTVNGDNELSKDLTKFLEEILHHVFMAGLEVGYDTRASLDRISA